MEVLRPWAGAVFTIDSQYAISQDYNCDRLAMQLMEYEFREQNRYMKLVMESKGMMQALTPFQIFKQKVMCDYTPTPNLPFVEWVSYHLLFDRFKRFYPAANAMGAGNLKGMIEEWYAPEFEGMPLTDWSRRMNDSRPYARQKKVHKFSFKYTPAVE